MKNKTITLLIFTLITYSSYTQTVQSLSEKLSNKVCDCIGIVNKYSDFQKKLDKCYDESINSIFINANSQEISILGNIDSLNLIKSNLEPLLKTKCEIVKSLMKEDLNSSVENSATKKTIACPVNFNQNTLKKAKRHFNEWDGKIVAFDAMVVEVEKGYNERPYYKVELSNKNQIWIASTVTSGFEVVGKELRILGYFSIVNNDIIAEKYNKTGFHILAISIIDMETKQMSILPGSEEQIKQWINGEIPSER